MWSRTETEERKEAIGYSQTESKNPFSEACKTVDGVCILGVTPKAILPAPPEHIPQDIIKLRTIKQKSL